MDIKNSVRVNWANAQNTNNVAATNPNGQVSDVFNIKTMSNDGWNPDNFKDTFGNLSGDKLAQAVKDKLKESFEKQSGDFSLAETALAWTHRLYTGLDSSLKKMYLDAYNELCARNTIKLKDDEV